MVSKRILFGAGICLVGMGMIAGGWLRGPSKPKTLPLNEARAAATAALTLPGEGVYDLYKVSGDEKSQEGYVLRIKTEKGLTLVPDNEGLELRILDEKQRLSEDFRCRMKVINPDGSVHYDVEERTKEGKLIRKYIEPSNERYEINPNAQLPGQAPQFHSTLPVIKNPDGSMDFYRPLREGERLNDVMRDGPDVRFLPIPTGTYAPK